MRMLERTGVPFPAAAFVIAGVYPGGWWGRSHICMPVRLHPSHACLPASCSSSVTGYRLWRPEIHGAMSLLPVLKDRVVRQLRQGLCGECGVAVGQSHNVLDAGGAPEPLGHLPHAPEGQTVAHPGVEPAWPRLDDDRGIGQQHVVAPSARSNSTPACVSSHARG